MTLAEFLLARIAEDEAVAHESREHEHLRYRDSSHLHWHRDVSGYGQIVATSGRVLAECEAKRRIVERHAGAHHCPDPQDDEWATWYIAGEPVTIVRPCGDLRDLASPYADHPDYRVEWKP